MTSGTELILIGWKIVPNEEHVQCDHRFASQPLANEPLHSSQLFDTSLHRFHVCRCTDTGGMRPLLLQHRTISFILLEKSANCLFARSPPCTKVCKKTSLSRYYTLCFCTKQHNFHLLIYSQPPVVRHFTNWWHLSHFPWTTAFTRTFATSTLWCYSFNGTIKLYDISCATLYLPSDMTYNFSNISFLFSIAPSPNATWTASESRFTHSTDRAKILSLSAAPQLWSPCPWTLHGRPNQRWTYRRWC